MVAVIEADANDLAGTRKGSAESDAGRHLRSIGGIHLEPSREALETAGFKKRFVKIAGEGRDIDCCSV